MPNTCCLRSLFQPCLGAVVVGLLVAHVAFGAAPASDDGWAEMHAILARIKAPVFPDRDFVITDFGAQAGGTADARPAIVKAIQACVQAGGGRVVIPTGLFLTNGPVHLQSNVNLHVSEGATLKFGTNAQDYLPVVLTRWEGIMLYNYSPLIYAYKQTNIAITGTGTIDGSGKEGFYQWVRLRGPNNESLHEASRQLLWKMGAAKAPVDERRFGEAHYLRPGGLEPVECDNILIEGVTVTNMPFWTVHPVLSRNVTVRNIKVDSTTGNNDGVDPDSCVDVLIEDSYFKTGDDGIAIKSGRDQDGWTVGRPTENVVVRRCTFAGKLYGLAIGSEISGGVRNIFAEDCNAVAGRAAIYTKANLDRGGIVENVRVRRFMVSNMTEAAIRFESNYHGHRGEHHSPVFRDFIIEDVTCTKSNAYAIYADGQPDSPVRDVVLRRIRVDEAKVPLWIRHVENFRLEDVVVNGVTLPIVPPPTPPAEEKLPIRD
jgi:polygalacturonase